MNLSDQTYLLIGAVLGLPMLIIATLNCVLRDRGGFARGWAGAIFVTLCWTVGMVLIVTRAVN